jgi:hypothetical protein
MLDFPEYYPSAPTSYLACGYFTERPALKETKQSALFDISMVTKATKTYQ